jgi:hypothetical protein
MTSTLPKGTLGSVDSLLAATFKEILIGTTSSGISYHLRDIYSICRCCWNVATYDIYFICRCCWNVATYKWKVHNGIIEIISFVVKFRS